MMPASVTCPHNQDDINDINSMAMRRLLVWWFKLKGWKVVNGVPSHIKKAVIIAAPHTSNWDFVYTIATFTLLKTPVKFLAKKELFKWPLAGLIRGVGGIPVQRNKSEKLVDTMISLINNSNSLLLMIPAEGTRSRVNHWKSGFYYVALGAGVPVLPGYLCYATKTAGFGAPIVLSGNADEDAAAIKAFYADKIGRHHHLFNLDAIKF
jgi:1-acyl-sn-glycerol-3-phosphate acyltransferase